MCSAHRHKRHRCRGDRLHRPLFLVPRTTHRQTEHNTKNPQRPHYSWQDNCRCASMQQTQKKTPKPPPEENHPPQPPTVAGTGLSKGIAPPQRSKEDAPTDSPCHTETSTRPQRCARTRVTPGGNEDSSKRRIHTSNWAQTSATPSRDEDTDPTPPGNQQGALQRSKEKRDEGGSLGGGWSNQNEVLCRTSDMCHMQRGCLF